MESRRVFLYLSQYSSYKTETVAVGYCMHFSQLLENIGDVVAWKYIGTR